MWDIGISILADNGDPAELTRWLSDPRIAGATTNPSLLRKSGISNADFLAKVAAHLTGRPVSMYPVESSHDDFLRAAECLKLIYPNVFIKVPVLDRDGSPNRDLLVRVAAAGHNVNVTAVHDAEQAALAEEATRAAPQRVASVFAGRIADSGRDPAAEVASVCHSLARYPDFEVIWASSRQIFDAELARRAGCHFITMPTGIFERAQVWGYGATALTVLAVRQFEAVPEQDRARSPAHP